MTQTSLPDEFPALLTLMKKLAELVDPLKAIIAAEEKPDLSKRIERFLEEVTRISDQIERAVTIMEADREDRATLQRLEEKIEAQGQALKIALTHLLEIRSLFGAPLDTPEPR